MPADPFANPLTAPNPLAPDQNLSPMIRAVTQNPVKTYGFGSLSTIGSPLTQALAPTISPAAPHAASQSPVRAAGAVPSRSAPAALPAGPGGDIKVQLRQGFTDAGRADLAAAVDTQAFQTWINKESGWNASEVSGNTNHGAPNGGLFQFSYYWHPNLQQYFQGGKFTLTPYQQAQIVAKDFGHLTPGAINTYAQQIAAGQYAGWG